MVRVHSRPLPQHFVLFTREWEKRLFSFSVGIWSVAFRSACLTRERENHPFLSQSLTPLGLVDAPIHGAFLYFLDVPPFYPEAVEIPGDLDMGVDSLSLLDQLLFMVAA